VGIFSETGFKQTITELGQAIKNAQRRLLLSIN
jgi:hypothetical protein